MTRTFTIAAVLALAACAESSSDDALYSRVHAEWIAAGLPDCDRPAPREVFGSEIFTDYAQFSDVCDGLESDPQIEGRACFVADADVIIIADGTATGGELEELERHEMLHALAACAGLDATTHDLVVFECTR